MVIFPVTMVTFAAIGAACYFVAKKQLSGGMLLIGFALSIVEGWFFWHFMVGWWRSWAFPNVKNIYQLKKRASQEKLLWPSVGFFTKAPPKFEKPGDLVLDEGSEIPKAIKIYYSRSKNLFQMTFALFAMLIVFSLFLAPSNEFELDGCIFSVIILIGAAISASIEYKETTKIQAQIIINHKGIWTINSGFNAWKDIINEDVYSAREGKSIRTYLAYNFVGGSEYLQIDDYNVEAWQLEKLL